MKKFFRHQIPIYIAFIAFFTIGGMIAFVAVFFQETIDNYEIFIPQASGPVVRFEFGSRPALQNADYFNSVRESFMRSKTSFIEADLSQMRLKLYRGGSSLKNFRF